MRISNQLEQIQQLINEIELAQLNHEVYEKLKQGNEALQSLNQVLFYKMYKKLEFRRFFHLFKNPKNDSYGGIFEKK